MRLPLAFLTLLSACMPGPRLLTGTVREVDTGFLKDFTETRGFLLGRPVKPRPTPDGKAVLFLRSPPRSPVMHLYELDLAGRRERVLLTPEKLLGGAAEVLSPEERAQRERMRVSAKGFTRFDLSGDGARVLVTMSGKPYVLRRSDGQVREVRTGKGTLLDPKFSPDGRSVSYILDADVYVQDLESGKETRLTEGGTPDVSHGLAEFVAQEEMDRFTGYWWSPDSRFIAYEEADTREVEVWRVADPARPGQTPHPQRYPRPGRNNATVRLGVVRASGGETRWILWDRVRYPYLATVKWDEGGPLTIVVQNRRQQELAVLAADPVTGATSALLTETDPTWLNLDQRVPRWLEDGSGFLWTNERGGGRRLELRDLKGALVRVLVPPEAGFAQLLHVDAKARALWFRGGANPTESHLFRVGLDGGPARPLTREPGWHVAAFGRRSSLFVRGSSGLRSLPRWTVHSLDGARVAELGSVAEEPPFVPTTEVVKVGQGEGFYCAVTRPRDFRVGSRYPVIVAVYGGPHVQVVTASMSQRLQTQWLADQGFIVVSADGRGTPRRGREWERAIRGSFAKVPIADQVAALRALGRRYPEMDLGRVGITGWSFGGFLSALAVLREPAVFKAAVAGAPVTDWEDYDTHYTERYLGLPSENAAGYHESNLTTYARELSRPLLLVHGTADDNVFFLHTLKLSRALFLAGKDHEVLPLSGLTHMVPNAVVKQRVEERIVRFFLEHL